MPPRAMQQPQRAGGGDGDDIISGVDMAFCSTTRDREVAMRYASSASPV